jgi:hypothetical protein
MGCIGAFVAWWRSIDMDLGPMCGNRPVAEYPSPDGALKLEVFERDCGATTGFSMQASLLDVGDPLPNEAGNAFVADSSDGTGKELRVRWRGTRALTLEHRSTAHVVRAVTDVSGVSVVHTTFDR